MDQLARIKQLERIVYNERIELELMRKEKFKIKREAIARGKMLDIIKTTCETMVVFDRKKIIDCIEAFFQEGEERWNEKEGPPDEPGSPPDRLLIEGRY